MLNPQENNDQLLNFEELNMAFSEKPQEFIQILKVLQEDFINNHMLIIEALADNNLENFRKVFHDLKGNIILSQVPHFTQLMEKVRKHLEGKTTEKTAEIRQQVHLEFNLIFQSLENKINELSARL